MIRLANQTDILPAYMNVYEKLFDKEELSGTTTNWKRGVYPTPAHLEKALNNGALYVLEENDEICACVILNNHQPPEYRDVPWLYIEDDSKVLVIHTLCVSPLHAGKGYGKKLVEFSENHAKETGCNVMRFDTYVQNKPAETMYLKLGYRRVGVFPVLHEGVIQEDLILFEKKL